MQAHPIRRRAICGSRRARLPNEEVGRGGGRRASGAQKNLSPFPESRRHRMSPPGITRDNATLQEMLVHLGGEHAFGQSLLQFADQAVITEQRSAVLAPFQQLVDQLVVNRGLGASCHEILLGSLSWLRTQNFLHPPVFASLCQCDARTVSGARILGSESQSELRRARMVSTTSITTNHGPGAA